MVLAPSVASRRRWIEQSPARRTRHRPSALPRAELLLPRRRLAGVEDRTRRHLSRGYRGSAHGRVSLLRNEERQGMRQQHLARSTQGRPPAGDPRCLRREAPQQSCPAPPLANAKLPASPRLHRQAQPNANTSIVATIAGLANRRSSAMLRAASHTWRLLGLAVGEGIRYERRARGAPSEATVSRPSSTSQSRFAVARRSGTQQAASTCHLGHRDAPRHTRGQHDYRGIPVAIDPQSAKDSQRG